MAVTMTAVGASVIGAHGKRSVFLYRWTVGGSRRSVPTNGPAVARRPRPITDAIEPEPFCDRVPGPFPEGPARGRCVPVSPSSLKEKKKENKSTFKAWREKKTTQPWLFFKVPMQRVPSFTEFFFAAFTNEVINECIRHWSKSRYNSVKKNSIKSLYRQLYRRWTWIGSRYEE